MGKLEQFHRNLSDIMYLKDNDWTKEEIIAATTEEFKDILNQLISSLLETNIYINKVFPS